MSMQGPAEANNREQKMEEILADLKNLLDTEDQETQKRKIESFVQGRLQELQEESPEKQPTLSLFNARAEGNFLHPETEIKRSMMVKSFRINDPDIYKSLLDALRIMYHAWNKPQVRSLIGHAIIYALGNYFGNHVGGNGTVSRNVEFYLDHSVYDLDDPTTFDHEEIDLKEIKGKNMAVCAEKATVAHNYLKFLGMNSHVIFSSNCKLDDSSDGHVYIIFSTKNGKFIFDPTNPVFVENSEGQIPSFDPAIYKISDEEYQHLLQRDGQQVTVHHRNKIMEGQERKIKEEQIRIYG